MCLWGAFVGSMFLFCGVHAVASCVAVQGYGAQMVICSGHSSGVWCTGTEKCFLIGFR